MSEFIPEITETNHDKDRGAMVRTIASSSSLDTSVVAYEIFEPA